mgnify:CR=1 FL=1
MRRIAARRVIGKGFGAFWWLMYSLGLLDYRIEGRETIPDGWSKRLRSFLADRVPIERVYRLCGAPIRLGFDDPATEGLLHPPLAHTEAPEAAPIRIVAGAFGQSRPWEDVFLAPDQIVGGGLSEAEAFICRACDLLDHPMVMRERASQATFYQFSLPEPAAVLSEKVWVRLG